MQVSVLENTLHTQADLARSHPVIAALIDKFLSSSILVTVNPVIAALVDKFSTSIILVTACYLMVDLF